MDLLVHRLVHAPGYINITWCTAEALAAPSTYMQQSAEHSIKLTSSSYLTAHICYAGVLWVHT